jgi:hypothetical protein
MPETSLLGEDVAGYNPLVVKQIAAGIGVTLALLVLGPALLRIQLAQKQLMNELALV